MEAKFIKSGFGWAAMLAGLTLSAAVAAQEAPSACVEQGALAFDNWTKSDSGGSGMPDGETDSDYVRCKACHGWDHLGTDGGYVRRSRNAGRPNAGAGDGDQTSRNISFASIPVPPVTADMIFHAGTGRSFADGSGSWVPLDGSHSAANKAAHSNSYTLGNQHPDFSTGGANALTQEQADCLAEFLNFADAGWDAYFDAIFPDQNPVLYTIRADADAGRGEAFYNSVCFACHGDPTQDSTPFALPDGGSILSFVADSGHLSELASKVRWGNPDTLMTRDALENPTALETADVMLYLQQLGGTGFAMTAGLNGNWWNGADRSGEGFQLEVSANGLGGLTFVATFYSYAPMGMMGTSAGNQMFLIAVGPVTGNTADVDVFITGGGMYGGGLGGAGSESTWGTGTFVADSCGSISMELVPNQQMMGNGFTTLMYDLIRLTSPAVACP
jgi:cytochrome c553